MYSCPKVNTQFFRCIPKIKILSKLFEQNKASLDSTEFDVCRSIKYIPLLPWKETQDSIDQATLIEKIKRLRTWTM